MVSWVIIVIVVLALLIFAKTTGFRYGKIVTWTIAGSLIFLVATFIYVVTATDADLTTFEGFAIGIKAYAVWIGDFFQITKSITGNAVKTYWNNATIQK